MRALGVVAFAFVVSATACSRFSADAGTCPRETCDADAGVACWFADFAAPTCPTVDWDYFSEPSVGSSLECGDGALHVIARNTADVEATFGVKTPRVPYGVRIALTLVLNEWDGGRVLAADIGANPAFVLLAGTGLGRRFALQLCPTLSADSGCLDVAGASLEPGTPHVLAVDITSEATRLSVDCGAPTSLPPIALEQNADLRLSFGKSDGDPIDGSIDDVKVSWSPP